MIDPKNVPTEPGMYWARYKGFAWWNIIVEIAGDAPYLYVYRIWNRPESTATTGTFIPADLEICEYGPRIIEDKPKD